MAQCFIHAPSFSSFRMLRDEHHMSIMETVAEENEYSTLTIPNLKFYVNTEHSTLMKAIKKVVLENYEKGHHDRFCQFAHDRATLKNKDKHQVMGMQFSDKDCKHDGAIALVFRKPISHKANKVAELAQKACNETFGLEFYDMFSSSVQDLAASTVAKELQVDKVECEMHQGKVGDSAVGVLVRTVNKVKLLFICIVVVFQCFNLNHMCFFIIFRK